MARNIPRLSRKKPARSFTKQIHIYTEGSVTEEEYINNLKKTILSGATSHHKFSIRVKNSSNKTSPKNIQKSIRNDVRNFEEKQYHEIWVLIDEDNWPQEDIENLKHDTFIKNKVQTFRVLISSPKFELWLLLHFENGIKISNSADVDRRLKPYIPDYNKHCSQNLFNLSNVRLAITNAKKLIQNKSNVYTEAYILFEYLLSLHPPKSTI